MNIEKQFDVIVVGGGHAGVEAASAAARLGAQTLLITHNKETLGAMSCNPSIGGIAKGHLVKEIDALSGLMAKAADVSGIQFRMLNSSKGPAVRATRAQIDRNLYKKAIRYALEHQENLTIFQDAVDDLLIKQDQVQGVVTQIGLYFFSRAVVLTTGTFLNGKVHIGLTNYQAGRMGDPASIRLASRLQELPLRMGRLKTGTPPRIDGNTIDYSKMLKQPGDSPIPIFSFLGTSFDHPEQVICHIARTNEKTHDIIRSGLDRSPLFRGDIKGIGPRYCPSIEDKIVRFADKLSHQIFVEPEGLDTTEIYPNGISTSLPFDIQYRLVHSIEGFEHAHITRAGYAIEYDFCDPRDLKFSLETKCIRGLFFAGQINGTTGYEEAAAQGLIAGLNAAYFAQNKEPWTPRRDEAYMGVMVDDLITKGTKEPYRMFTSRAEYRLLLREDNADLRLTPKGRELGLVDDGRWKAFQQKQDRIEKEKQRFQSNRIKPETKEALSLSAILEKPIQREYRLIELLKRPELTYDQIANVFDWDDRDPQAGEQVEIQAKYSGYIERQQLEIRRHIRYENTQIPEDINYDQIPGLSMEVRQKLKSLKPETIGIASRISGVTPAAISVLLIYLKKPHKITTP